MTSFKSTLSISYSDTFKIVLSKLQGTSIRLVTLQYIYFFLNINIVERCLF